MQENTMEIQIIQPTKFIEKIEFNFEEIKKSLESKLENYQSLVYNDTEILSAKKDRAELNKLKTDIENKRKEIKNQCLKPYEEFEIKIKELVALVEKPIKEIDSQVKNYEETQKEEKRKQIEDYYNLNAGSLKEIISFDKIFIDKWLNSTVKVKSVLLDIDLKINELKNNFTIIEDLNSEYKSQVKDKFIQTLDLTLALSENKRLTEQSEKLKKIEEESKKEEVKQVPVVEEIIKKEVEAVAIVKEETKEEPKEYDVRIWATDSQIKLLKQFLTDNSIEYGCVK
jgi:hypothetical protein